MNNQGPAGFAAAWCGTGLGGYRARRHTCQRPAEPGAFLVRFLRDQQDCVIWYLCLRPPGERFVVRSHPCLTRSSMSPRSLIGVL